jgi:hypothetical protein
MRQQVFQHDLRRDARGEAVARGHELQLVPLGGLRGQAVELRGPLGRGAGLLGLGRQVEPGVQVRRKSGEGVALFRDAGLDQFAAGR